MQQQERKINIQILTAEINPFLSPHIQPSLGTIITSSHLLSAGCRANPAAGHARTHAGCKFRGLLLRSSSKRDETFALINHSDMRQSKHYSWLGSEKEAQAGLFLIRVTKFSSKLCTHLSCEGGGSRQRQELMAFTCGSQGTHPTPEPQPPQPESKN